MIPTMRARGPIVFLTAGLLGLGLLAGGYWIAYRAYSTWYHHLTDPFSGGDPTWLPVAQTIFRPAEAIEFRFAEWRIEREYRAALSGRWTTEDGRHTIVTTYRGGMFDAAYSGPGLGTKLPERFRLQEGIYPGVYPLRFHPDSASASAAGGANGESGARQVMLDYRPDCLYLLLGDGFDDDHAEALAFVRQPGR